MNYQGPESFRGLIEHEYNRIRDVFTRQDTPHIIVGGIGKIYNNGQKVVTEGDTETNSEIDNRFRELLKPNQSPKQMEISYKRLIALCDEANILRPTVFGEYNHSLDTVVIAPNRVVRYVIASRTDPRIVFSSRDRELMTDYLLDMNFPHRFTHEVVHWDFGNTDFNRDLQKYFYALDMNFDKAKDGKFSFDTKAAKESDYEHDARESGNNDMQANAVLSNHFATMMRLGLFDLEEMAAEIGATLITPPNHGVFSISGNPDIARKLFIDAKRMGPKDFIAYLKMMENESYSGNRNVFETLS